MTVNDEYHINQVKKRAIELQRKAAEQKRQDEITSKAMRSARITRIRDIIVATLVLAIIVSSGYQIFNVSSHTRNRAIIALLMAYLIWRRFSAIKKK